MGKLVLKDCSIVIASVDFSNHTSSVEIALKKASIDSTNFSGGGKEAVAGLREDLFTIDLQQDFDPAEVDATLYPLYANETEFTIVVKPHQSAVSTSNPSYTATCILLEYSPLAGKVGELSNTKIKFQTQRSGIVRATS